MKDESYLRLGENLIDMLTKVVITIKFNHCLDLINIAKVWLHRCEHLEVL